ncbi:class I SAM-dependent rRNA methyltransferase [Desulforegula conservatrix]|uniref:class I SAM-dependent rRNA methyltransferase n=1 Tax=Desulforegula conservatrix TaxID=153026 RepID=UPI0004019FE2|nr:class I SAM-dependent methyltransferase [Desulforegula conservatrix]
MSKILVVKEGREKSFARRHPWVFSGAVKKEPKGAESGETVEVRSAKGDFLCLAAYSPFSQIRARVWSFDPEEYVDEGFFRLRIEKAASLRSRTEKVSSAVRIVSSESDYLPGVIIDRYAGFLVCQFLSAGAEFQKKSIIAALERLYPESGIFERSDSSSRKKEGLDLITGLIKYPSPPDLLEIDENGCRFLVDIKNGHKTGFYLDQRDNRRILGEYSEGKRVLNCFSYTGGFAISALKGGCSHATCVDVSESALEISKKNMELNGFENERYDHVKADVFAFLREEVRAGKRYDVIVLDPPKFAESAAQVVKAARGYKDIAMLAFKLLSPGGYLFNFSCSGHMDRDLFQKITADAALDAGRKAKITGFMNQAEDHPIALNFPESMYLKGFICAAE